MVEVDYSITKLFESNRRGTRLAAVFAALFIFTLLLSITFITVVALLTDGFTTLTGNHTCPKTTSQERTHTVNRPEYTELCLTEDCIRLSAHYLNNMNAEAKPCDDFYEFACGRYMQQKVVPQHEKRITVLHEMKQDLDRHLRDILEKTPRENASRAMKLAQIYYDSCMDEQGQSEMGTLPITSLISQLGGWELLTNARFESVDYHWEVLAGQLVLHGVDGLVKIFVHSSFDDSQQHMLMFAPPKLFLEKKKYYRDPPSSNAYLGFYRSYILKLLDLLGVDMEDESGVIEYQVNDMIDFERRIANLTRTENPRNHSVINNVMTYGAFKQRYGKVNWDLFFNDELRSHLGVLTDSVTINVVDLNYFDNLAALLQSKPMSAINNYLMWRLVSAYDAFMPKNYRKPYQEFQLKMFGLTSEVPQWESCVREVRDNLAMPLSTAYANSFFTMADRQKAEVMISDLKDSMEQTLMNADWMDEATRESALLKLERMGHKIGFPDYLMNETAVLEPYAGVRLVANQYFENAVSLKKTLVRENLAKLQRPPRKDEWASPVVAVDAYHYFTGNEIIFPAGILQFPMFVADAPSYSNYGAIGMGIGHEITHGYDDLGAQYDEYGNVRGWWQEETLTTFNKKKQCFIAQYASKVEPQTGRKVDGRLTIGENIADNGGLRVAFQAYQMRASRSEDKVALPGMNRFTPQQLFFIAYANTWCEAVRPSAVDYIMDTDVHAFGQFRVNVPLQNFPSFSKAFDCPIGSNMNPFEKCRIW